MLDGMIFSLKCNKNYSRSIFQTRSHNSIFNSSNNIQINFIIGKDYQIFMAYFLGL
jgi:hypothetical protein